LSDAKVQELVVGHHLDLSENEASTSKESAHVRT
jgi:branched-chain amino acid transport system ATP-binding protein